MVVLRVERSLEARAERNRGSTGGSSVSGDIGDATCPQPSARAADQTANTNVSIIATSDPFFSDTFLMNSSVTLHCHAPLATRPFTDDTYPER